MITQFVVWLDLPTRRVCALHNGATRAPFATLDSRPVVLEVVLTFEHRSDS